MKRIIQLTGISAAAWLATCLSLASAPAKPPPPVGHFVPVATYDVLAGGGGSAEIVVASPNGMLLVYTDSIAHQVGFVSIEDPLNPTGLGTLDLGDDSPTSVAITPDGTWALVAVARPYGETVDEDGVTVDEGIRDGYLLAIKLGSADPPIVRELGGQPDSIAVSPDGRYAAVVIENERSEGGALPKAPPGNLTVFELTGTPNAWPMRVVNMSGYGLFPSDPEPEFVDIRADNVAAVTLQENNHVVMVDLPSGAVVGDFSAGITEHWADLKKDGQISFTDWLVARREPDAIAWTPSGNLITANEGDSDVLVDGVRVGGRNFTIFTPTGAVLFESGVELEMLVAAAGRYDDTRSGKKGVEVEGVEVGQYLNHTFFFIGMERAKSVAVYRFTGTDRNPKFIQLLPTGGLPEGLLAIPQRNLFVSADEKGSLSIFAGRPGNPR